RKRCQSAAQALAEAQYIRRDAKRFGGEHLPGPSNAGDNLIENQEDVVSVAGLPEQRQVLFWRIDDPAGVADRLNDERCHRLGIFHLDHIAYNGRAGDAAIRVTLAERAAVTSRWKHVQESRRQRLIDRFARLEPRCGKGTERGTVPRQIPANDL